MLKNEDCYNLLRLTARHLPDESRIQVGAGLPQVDQALLRLRPPRELVHATSTDYVLTGLDRHEMWFADVECLEGTGGGYVHVYAEPYALTTTVVIDDDRAIEFVWPRGRTSSGCRLIDDSMNWHYDDLDYSHHATVRLVGGDYTYEFTSYTYKLYEDPNYQIFKCWYPFDPNGPPEYRLDYSYIRNNDPSAVGSEPPRTATAEKRVTVRQRPDGVVFQLGGLGMTAVRVDVFDVAGRVTRSLSKVVPPGQREVEVLWDRRDDQGHGVASGAYFAKVWVKEEGTWLPAGGTRVPVVR